MALINIARDHVSCPLLSFQSLVGMTYLIWTSQQRFLPTAAPTTSRRAAKLRTTTSIRTTSVTTCLPVPDASLIESGEFHYTTDRMFYGCFAVVGSPAPYRRRFAP